MFRYISNKVCDILLCSNTTFGSIHYSVVILCALCETSQLLLARFALVHRLASRRPEYMCDPSVLLSEAALQGTHHGNV